MQLSLRTLVSRAFDEMLLERRAEIEKRLERMDRAIAVVGARVVRGGGSPLSGRKVPPKSEPFG